MISMSQYLFQLQTTVSRNIIESSLAVLRAVATERISMMQMMQSIVQMTTPFVLVGDKISVYWCENKECYPGTVSSTDDDKT